MRVENDTNEPVDYDQSGGSGDDEEFPSAQASEQGHLNANGGSATFSPAGSPPWTVTFTNDDTGAQCTSAPFSNASVTVTVKGFSPCDVEVS